MECTPSTRRGRRGKARQFLDAAETIGELAEDAADVADAYVTLLVHAGIAAADVVCCAALGIHAQGENHNEAITLLARVNRDYANDLRTLLGVKTKAGYSSIPSTAPNAPAPREQRTGSSMPQKLPADADRRVEIRARPDATSPAGWASC